MRYLVCLVAVIAFSCALNLLFAQEYRICKSKQHRVLEYYMNDTLAFSVESANVILIQGKPYDISFFNDKMNRKVGISVNRLKAGIDGFYVEDYSLTTISYRKDGKNCINADRFIYSIEIKDIKDGYYLLCFKNKGNKKVRIRIPMNMETKEESEKKLCKYIFDKTGLEECIRCE
jgi:hypothetical protein